VGSIIGRGFEVSRDATARFLIRLGVRPNHCTLLGTVFTCLAGICLAVGAGHQSTVGPPVDGVEASRWPWCVGAFLFLAAAMDMLDGAIARLARQSTRFGAFLDSVLDRVSDAAIFLGCAWYFAVLGNLTYTVLSFLCIINATMISYTKARAEALMPDCSVGYWLRGERVAAALICAFSAHIPTLLWQQATLPAFTWIRRIAYTRQFLRARQLNLAEPNRGPWRGAWGILTPWRFRRGTIPYDLVTASNIAFLLFGPWVWPVLYGREDPLRTWWSMLVG
jgi:CDP-diacylglycerol--glycerol-3-phosphate 3-phosphatidyltransferase